MGSASPADMLRQAADTIDQRGLLRDTPDGERSMRRAVNAFNNLLGGDRRLTEQEGWLFMCCLKMARGTAGSPHLDDAIDLAGYAALWGESLGGEEVKAPGTTTPHMTNCAVWKNPEMECNCGGWP